MSGLNTNVSCDAVLGPFTAVVGSTKRMSTKSGFPGSGGRESKIDWTVHKSSTQALVVMHLQSIKRLFVGAFIRMLDSSESCRV